MSAVEYISVGKDFVIGVAAVVGIFVALKGLQTWRRQLEGTAEFETARALIRATYKLRDEIRYCRIAGILSSEFPGSYDRHTATSAEQADAYAHIYQNRWSPVVDATQEFQVHILEAEALWGAELRKRCDDLTHCVSTLNWAIESFIENERSGGQDFQQDGDYGVKIRGQVSSSGGENNEFTKKIDSAIHALEEFLTPKLNRTSK